MANIKQNQGRTDRADLSLYIAHNTAHGHGTTFTRISREELIELVLKAQAGDKKAREEVIRQTVRFVQDQIFRVRNSSKDKVEADDLFQAGMMAVDHAIDKFDPSFGTSFLTHAGSWIFQGVLREIQNNSKFIRVPVHVWDAYRKLMATREALGEKYGIHPQELDFSKFSDAELAEAMEGDYEPHQVALIRQHFLGGVVSSYDIPLMGSEGDQSESIINMLSDPDAAENYLEENLVTESEVARIREMIGLLEPKARYVLMRRHGVGRDGAYFTLDMIGNELGVTRERVRQIEVQATNILKRVSAAYERGESIDSIRASMKRAYSSKPFIVPEGVDLTPEERQIMKLVDGQTPKQEQQAEPEKVTDSRRGRQPLAGPRYQGRVMPEWFDVSNMRSPAARKLLADDQLTREELFIRERGRAHQKAIQERLNARINEEKV